MFIYIIMFGIITVTILSAISIVLQILFLLDEDNKNDTNALTASWVSLVALCLMFVLPMAKRVIGEVGDWLFIVDSVVIKRSFLSAQGIAFGVVPDDGIPQDSCLSRSLLPYLHPTLVIL